MTDNKPTLTTSLPSPLHIGRLLELGQTQLDKERSATAEEKKGLLRGGNAGAIIDGQVYGSCHRIHHLRTLGIEVEADHNTQVMFDSGIANEESINKVLQASLPSGLKLLREEEFPLEWDCGGGKKGSGRPDFVYVDAEGKPVLGLELKSVSSIHTARNIIGEAKPSTSNLIQAANYSMRMGGIPYKLIYTSSPYWHINYNKHLETAFMDNPLVEHKGGRPFRVMPCRVVFDLVWKDGKFFYKLEGEKKLTATSLTMDSIVDYYEKTAAMGEKKSLGPVPTNKDLLGKKSYSPCDYCKLAEVCGRQTDYDKWMDEVVVTVRTLNEEIGK
jgi:hypothetical protein